MRITNTEKSSFDFEFVPEKGKKSVNISFPPGAPVDVDDAVWAKLKSDPRVAKRIERFGLVAA